MSSPFVKNKPELVEGAAAVQSEGVTAPQGEILDSEPRVCVLVGAFTS